MHVHQLLYQLSRHKLVLQGCLCLRVSKVVLWGLLRRRRGDKHANQQRYQPVSYTHLTLPTIYSV